VPWLVPPPSVNGVTECKAGYLECQGRAVAGLQSLRKAAAAGARDPLDLAQDIVDRVVYERASRRTSASFTSHWNRPRYHTCLVVAAAVRWAAVAHVEVV